MFPSIVKYGVCPSKYVQLRENVGLLRSQTREDPQHTKVGHIHKIVLQMITAQPWSILTLMSLEVVMNTLISMPQTKQWLKQTQGQEKNASLTDPQPRAGMSRWSS